MVNDGKAAETLCFAVKDGSQVLIWSATSGTCNGEWLCEHGGAVVGRD